MGIMTRASNASTVWTVRCSFSRMNWEPIHKLRSENHLDIIRMLTLPSTYFLTMLLIVEPDSWSMSNCPLVSIEKPSWPWAMYSPVTILYFLPQASLSIGSSSVWKEASLLINLGFNNHITRTLLPGTLRESHVKRNPEMAGNRLRSVW